MSVLDFEKFYKEDVTDFASYDNLRSIASYCDGLKNSGRKVIHAMIGKNINKKQRLDITANEVVSYSKYIHGSIEKVLVNMAQNFTGTNNINLLVPAGKFGTRVKPDASASRYISTYKDPIVNILFDKLDNDILESQTFEGFNIEPRFFIPILPMLLVNGSEKPSVGFAQKILPRDPKKLKDLIVKKLKYPEKPLKIPNPHWNGFSGKIDNLGEGSFQIFGSFERKGTTILITELPIGYKLTSYIKVLNELEDNKIIKTYKDYSDPKVDKFKFEVKVDREFMKMSDEKIYEKLKLYKKVTENYTCIDETNSIAEFTTPEEVFEGYFKVRYDMYGKRKLRMLMNLKRDIDILKSKFTFIKHILNEDIVIYKKSKQEIISQIVGKKYIIEVDGSYDYLLRMQIFSLTKEKTAELMKEIKDFKLEYERVKTIKESDMWLEDLKKLKL